MRPYSFPKRHRLNVHFLGISLAVMHYMTASAAGVHLNFREQVQVRKSEIQLEDIVEIEGDDLPVVLRLRQISLGQAPRVGVPVQLTRTDVTRWIHSKIGAVADPLVWHGAQSTEVTARTGKADVQQISHVAERTLKTWLGGFSSQMSNQIPARVVVSEQMPTRDVVLPMGDYTYIARPISAIAVPQKLMDVWVEVHSDGKFLQVVPVRFSIAMFSQAWVAKEKINSGSRLAIDACELKEVDLMSVARLADIRLVSDLAQANTKGIRARRSLNAGEILTYSNTETSPAIVRGEMVTLRTVAGSVQLEGRGRALEDGVVGQLVHFISDGATNRVVARISGPGVAEVE